ncbi:MAG: SAM-dependent methyltransferase [Myxococcota bacterium]
MTPLRLSRAFFEAHYRTHRDPWGFEHEPYERARHAAILDELGSRHFERAFEPGCAEGVLTEALADRCGELIATDISATAVGRARKRCRDKANVYLRSAALPDELPRGPFDLVVLAECGYYFEEDVLRELAERLQARLNPGATVLACHWRGRSPDHELHGDRVHTILDELPRWRRESEVAASGFRLTRWSIGS